MTTAVILLDDSRLEVHCYSLGHAEAAAQTKYAMLQQAHSAASVDMVFELEVIVVVWMYRCFF